MATYQVTGNCPVCGYTFDKEVTDDEYQTSIEDYSSAEDAVDFLLPEVPIPPEQAFQVLQILASVITVADAADRVRKKFSGGSSEETCPKCGAIGYEINTEEK